MGNTLGINQCFLRDGFHLGSGKDDQIALQNRGIVEWPELSGLSRRDSNEIKNFLAIQSDAYRNVFGTLDKDHPRTAIFIGTTNEASYLSDPTGNRRFWPVKVNRCDLDALKADIGQIWGEAVTLWRAGHRWWFDAHRPEDMQILRMAESEQSQRVAANLWDEVAISVAERLVLNELPLTDSRLAAWRCGHFSVDQVRKWITGGGNDSQIDDNTWNKVAKSLHKAGWENPTINGRRRWRLSQEFRHELCERLRVEHATRKPMREVAAENAAIKALEAAKASAVSAVQTLI